MAQLEYIKSNKDTIDIEQAKENYEKEQFLQPGENGELSQKQAMEQELVQLQVENKKLIDEQTLKASLFSNRMADYSLLGVEIDLKIEE